MKGLVVCLLVLMIGLGNPAFAQTAATSQIASPSAAKMTNADVIDLVGFGLSDDVVIDKIFATKVTDFDTSISGLKALKAAKVSNAVIRAMINPQPGPSSVDSGAAPMQPPPADQQAAGSQPPQPPAAIPQPSPFHSTDGKMRIYVTDHPINEFTSIVRGSGNSSSSASASASGVHARSDSESSVGGVAHAQVGDDPRTVEIQADVVKLCPASIMVSNNPDRADYILVFRRRGGARSSMFALGGLTGLAISAGAKVDGASLFQPNGDMIYATKENTVEKSIKDICDHIPPSSPPPSK